MNIISYACTACAILTMFGVAAAHDGAVITSNKFIAAERAIAAAAKSRDDVLASPYVAPDEKAAAETFYYSSFAWDHSDITVCFWQTDPKDDDLIEEIMKIARLWTEQANINFVHKDASGNIRRCSAANSADVRVTLDEMDSSYYLSGDPVPWDWSRYGKIARQNSAKVSMSLVHARQYLSSGDMINFHFLAAHEPGHALGLIHEHQRLNCNTWLDDSGIKIVWPNWTQHDIDIFKQNLQQIPESRFSGARAVGPVNLTSVMMYNFDQRIWRKPNPGEVNPCARPENVEYPSEQDIAGVVRMYGPKPSAASTSAAPPVSGGAAPAGAPPPAPTSSTRDTNHQILLKAIKNAEGRLANAKAASTGPRRFPDTQADRPDKDDIVAQHEHDRDALKALITNINAAVEAASK